jgi:hypothetical protein
MKKSDMIKNGLPVDSIASVTPPICPVDPRPYNCAPQITMHEFEQDPGSVEARCQWCGEPRDYYRHGKLPRGGDDTARDPDFAAMQTLRTQYPHGHPDFLPKLIAEAKLHSDKNKDYAGGGDPLGNFTRVAAICALYPGLTPSNPATVAIIYALKQIDQILWSLSRGYEGNIEGVEARAQDVSVYFTLADILHKEYGCQLNKDVPI